MVEYLNALLLLLPVWKEGVEVNSFRRISVCGFRNSNDLNTRLINQLLLVCFSFLIVKMISYLNDIFRKFIVVYV